MATDPGQVLQLIGSIAKAQGTRGGFLLNIDISASMDEAPELLYLRYPDQQWVPYRIEEWRPHQTRRGNVFFVRLIGIDNRTEAERLRGQEVKTDRVTELPSDTEDGIGYTVFREDGTNMGDVMDIMYTPAYRILVVLVSGKSVLIPWIEPFVWETDHVSRSIRTRNTEELETL